MSRPLPSGTVPAPAQTDQRGDGPPNYGDNHRWKHRAPLSAEDTRLARAAADRIRPALRRLRQANDLSADSVERELLGLGHPRERVLVRPITRNPLSADTASPEAGAVYSVLVGQRACVDGDVRRSRLLVQVEGTIADGGCLEPFTH